MFVSKALSFSRPSVMEKLMPGSEFLPTLNNLPHEFEYFFVGLPSYLPITPEASLLFVFSDRFMETNKKSISFGSVGDTGGVAAGYIPEIPSEYVHEMKLSGEKFTQLISSIRGLPVADRYDLMRRRPVKSLLPILNQVCSRAVVDALRKSERQDLWTIEFALKQDFRVLAEDVLSAFIPNTYRHSPMINGLIQKLGKRAILYNPKNPVITHANQEAHVRSWLLRKPAQ